MYLRFNTENIIAFNLSVVKFALCELSKRSNYWEMSQEFTAPSENSPDLVVCYWT